MRLTSYLKSYDFGRKYAISRLTSYLKSDDFGRKYVISRLTSFYKKGLFWTEIRDVGRKYMILRLASYLKSDYFGRKYAMLAENTRIWTKIKYVILRLTSYVKIADFGRKCAISQPLLDMRPALRAGLSGGSSLGQRPDTLFISAVANVLWFVSKV